MKQIDSFRARTIDGQLVTIVEYQHYVDARTLDKPNAPPLETQKEFRTHDGRAVNRITDDEFEILDPFGEFRVRRVR